MINRRMFLTSLAASSVVSAASEARLLDNRVQKVPAAGNGVRVLGPRPLPDRVHGMGRCIIDLNGPWWFSAQTPASFDRPSLEKLNWQPVQMPNELAMQGISIKQDVEYLLRRTFNVPADFAGKSIVVRFDGVYSYARIWVNGRFVREHHGGFTSWDCDVTNQVEAGHEAELVVVLTDRTDDPSIGTTYAKHIIGGLLRDVRLVALPRTHIAHLQLSASLDEIYKTGLLDLAVILGGEASTEAKLVLSLRDPMGAVVPIRTPAPQRYDERVVFEPIRIEDVERWDSEHPRLYELTLELVSGKDVELIRKQIGFRRIERHGNRILVNGDPIVLRGVCRHDMHPTLGRAQCAEYDESDPALFRRAHINFVRVDIHPPTEAFLAACDREGIYVEEEAAVCFWGDDVQADAQMADRFVNQFAEMIARDSWHPCVLLWSLGNESAWGSYFKKELEHARQADPDRLLMFSWSENLDFDRRKLDTYSSHYPMWNGDLGSSDYPVLHDEFGHISCYNIDGLRRDPGIRNFWGRSIAIFGKRFLETPGCMGGAIWAGIDDVFLLPDKVVGYGAWGIIDGWRREKPEFWLVRKAYSPIRLKDEVLPLPESGEEPVLAIGNGYNHTNLKTLTVEWEANGLHGVVSGPDVAPHEISQFRLPVTGLKRGQVLALSFKDAESEEIDRFELPIGKSLVPVFPSSEERLQIRRSGDELSLSGRQFTVSINRKTGLIQQARVHRRIVMEGGPHLDLGQERQTSWTLAKWDEVESTHSVRIQVSGESRFGEKVVELHYELEVFGDGRMDLRYRLVEKPSIEVSHLGMAFVLPASVDRLAWHRKGLWSVYPEDHIGRVKGTAPRFSPRSHRISRSKPDWPWAEDVHEPALNGYDVPANAATNDFRSLKENIYWAACLAKDRPEHVRVEGRGDIAVRLSPIANGQVDLNIYNFWSFPELSYGNYLGPEFSNTFRWREGGGLTPPENILSIRLVESVETPLVIEE